MRSLILICLNFKASIHLVPDITCNFIGRGRMCLRFGWHDSSSHKSPLHSIHSKSRRLTGSKYNTYRGFLSFKKSRTTGVPVSIEPKLADTDVSLIRLIWRWLNLTWSTENWFIRLYLVFSVESIGVDGVRRKWAQHLGLARNFFCGRHREITARDSVETNWLQWTLA